MTISFNAAAEILQEIKCPPYGVRVVPLTGDFTVFALQAEKAVIDIDTGEPRIGRGGKYYISPYSTREEIVQKALQAILALTEHEVREHFLWRGKRIFGPHLDHDKLWEIAEDTVKRKVAE